MTCFLKKLSALSLILLLVLSCMPCSANAIGTIDQNRVVSLKVSCKHEDFPIKGMQFELYYVADVIGYNQYQLAGDFTDYPVKLNDLDASDWRALTRTLVYYTQADGITPIDKNITDATGVVMFPSEAKTLSPGLYLVKAKPCVVGQDIYYAESFMICLPGTDLASGDWNYDVTVQAKCSKESPSYGTTNRKVLKIWKDEKGENLPKALYPEKVVVKLWKNDTIYDIVTLNETNNWRHDWMNLPKYDKNGVKIEWGLTEDPIDEYTVSVVLEQITFVVTNRLDLGLPIVPDSPGDPDDPEKPDNPGTPSETPETIRKVVKKVWDDKGYESKRPSSIQVQLMRNGAVYETVTLNANNNWQHIWSSLQAKDSNGKEIQWTVKEVDVSGYVVNIDQHGDTFLLTNSPVKPSLPQTGVLWWPVPVLAAAGLIFLIAGHLMRGRRKDA